MAWDVLRVAATSRGEMTDLVALKPTSWLDS
jgi:hypothetical protein